MDNLEKIRTTQKRLQKLEKKLINRLERTESAIKEAQIIGKELSSLNQQSRDSATEQ